MFEIRELRHLLSIDEFRHFGRAADAVSLSQPALTKSLQRIEIALGAQLFERSRARVVPTAIGNEVLQRARRLVDGAADLKRAVDQMNGAELSSITIGVGPAMSESFIAQAIAQVTQSRPQTQIAVRVDHWRQLSTWLLAGELDFYIADIGEAKLDKRFHYTNLPAQDFVWFARTGHPLAARRRKPISRADLLRYPLATPKMPPWATDWFAAAFGDLGVAALPRPFPAIECESFAMLKRIVLESDCISACLEATVAKELEEGAVTILPIDAPTLTTQAGIIHLRDDTLSALAQDLIAAIAKIANHKSK
jgi:DNA-binding transcriptional LysR family regulator